MLARPAPMPNKAYLARARSGGHPVDLTRRGLSRFRPVGEHGQGLAEYALILALIAVIAIGALVFLGSQISGILSTIGKAI